MNEPQERLAIMKRVGFGLRDVGDPVLWFDAYVSESLASLQVLHLDDAVRLIKDAGVYDVHDLEGKACWVSYDINWMRFLRYADI